MATFSMFDTATEQVLHSAVSSLAFPTASTDGASITVAEKNPTTPNTPGAWRLSGQGGARLDAAIFIESSTAQTFSAGLGLYGYRADKSKWYLVGALNGGTAISVLGAATGWSTVVEAVGGYDRLAVGPLTSGAVTTGVGTATIRACQIRTGEDQWQ